MDTDLQAANTKFVKGLAISDDELRGLICLYSSLYEGLGVLGNEYWLARNPIGSSLHALRSFAENRKGK